MAVLSVLERLSREVLILDGGTGTALQTRGLPAGYPPDLWSVERPMEVRRLHEAYVEAGADILFTNTFGASRLRLEPHGWGGRVPELNRAAVALAKAAAQGAALVAGDIGPCGVVATTFRQISRSEARSIIAEQVEALALAGVDLLAIETISDLEEMEVAVSAARAAVPDLPILASLTFTRDGKLQSGEGAAGAARALEAMGVDVAGANCSFGFASLLPICKEMAAATKLPLAMKPSAGVPPASPLSENEATEYARRFVEAGANLVGGCCGVNPAMLRAIALAVKGMAPVRHPPVGSCKTPA
jgi:5-methyltetrahydrofolate--homocysteine methyltransferase